MAVPEGLRVDHHRDLVGRESRPLARRALLAAICAFLVLGLLDVFGQAPSSDAAESRTARLAVSAPSRLRGGLLFQAKLHVEARRAIADATIVLDSGWLENMTLNTVAPAPVGEASRDGDLALELGRIPAGEDYVLYLQFQVNPTAVGFRSQDVGVYDGERLLVSLDRRAIVWP